MEASLRIGYITSYNKEEATVGVKLIGGPHYDSIPLDFSLSAYTVPLLPLLETDADGQPTVARKGSLCYVAKFSDQVIKVVKLFNDDPLITQADDTTLNVSRPKVVDALLKSLGAGDSVYSALGYLDVADKLRVRGSWLMLKNTGEVTLSNESSSAQLIFDDIGAINLQGVGFKIGGLKSSIEEATDVLTLSLNQAKILLSDSALTLEYSGTAFYIDEISGNFSSQNLSLEGVQSIVVSTSELTASAKNMTLTANSEFHIIMDSGLTVDITDSDFHIAPNGLTINLGGNKPVVCAKPGVTAIKSFDDLMISSTVTTEAA